MNGKLKLTLEKFYLLVVVILLLILFLQCESPTAVKERTKQTEQIRNDNGRK